MLKYKYTARRSTGEIVKSTVEAESEREAIKLIKSQDFVPIDIKQLSNQKLFNISNPTKRIKSKDKVLFARQLSTLINAGLPIIQSLRNVSEQTANNNLKSVINDLINKVEGGSSLSAALSNHKDVFNAVFISLIAAGETSGTLDSALERIAIQQEKDADIISKVRGALVYPIIVVLVMIAVVTFMLVKVIPQVKVLYKTFPGATLPLVTRILLALSSIVIKYWWLLLILMLLFIFVLRYYSKTQTGKVVFDRFKLNVPPFSGLYRKLYMARFARTGSTLFAAGVPLLQVLDIAGNAIDNTIVQASLIKASELVKGGKSLSESLQGDPNFISLVPNMIKIGEESGSMEKMMSKTADYYEKEVDTEIKNVSTIIEPVMMILLGIVALTIVAAVLLPIYGLAGSGAIGG